MIILCFSTDKPESPVVRWFALQTMLEEAESDAFILLDCCAAASSAESSGSGITEVIAACGFETMAPGVGQHSFTRSLIDELKYLSHGTSFSVAVLHNKVLSRQVNISRAYYCAMTIQNFHLGWFTVSVWLTSHPESSIGSPDSTMLVRTNIEGLQYISFLRTRQSRGVSSLPLYLI